MTFKPTLSGLVVALLLQPMAPASAAALDPLRLSQLDQDIQRATPQLIQLRHDIHQHPELGNREFETAKRVAQRLRELGLEVQTDVAHTGVVGLLKGGKPGPVVAIRSELDALPVTEQTGLPFASSVTVPYSGNDFSQAGKKVGVMHACGHDAHIAIVLGVAEVLAARKDTLPGSVKFIFQPAEEGVPVGETGGARLMIEQGVLSTPAPEAIFGLHVGPGVSGSLSVSRQRTTAAADTFVATVTGEQTHGAFPWAGIDPIPLAAQIILGWQTIPSRQVDLVALPPPVISVGKIDAGVRSNIIPAEVRLEGTLRTLTDGQRSDVIDRLRRTASKIAESAGASATLQILPGSYSAGYNNSALVDALLPELEATSTQPVEIGSGVYAADDFAEYSRKIPGVFFGLGVTPPGVDPAHTWPNHSPKFLVDDNALPVGVRALSRVTLAYLATNGFNLSAGVKP